MTQLFIQTRQAVELAAVLANQADAIVRNPSPLSRSSIESYWTTSQCRQQNWGRALRHFEIELSQRSQETAAQTWRDIIKWSEEILVSEVLTRVWTAIAVAYDRANHDHEVEPMVRSIYAAHVEARTRVLRMLVEGRGIKASQAITLNQIRRSTERWTDLFLGYVNDVCDIREFAFDAARVQDFCDGLRCERKQSWGHYTWPLVLSSLRNSFSRFDGHHCPNYELSDQIMSHILGAFGPDHFDATGQFQSLWQVRLTHVSNDAAGLIDQLIADNDGQVTR